MPVYVLQESTYSGPIPEDEILSAEVVGVKEVKKPFQDKDTGKDIVRVEFSFVVHDEGGSFDLQRLWGDTSTVFTNNSNCRLYAWTQELLGQELPPNFALDTDALIGARCRVVIGQKEYQKDGEDKVRNFVKDVIRVKTARPLGDEEPF